jgi:hypothetical protein
MLVFPPGIKWENGTGVPGETPRGQTCFQNDIQQSVLSRPANPGDSNVLRFDAGETIGADIIPP